MGEMLARAPVSMTSQPDSRPLLRVPFVPVDAAPGEERRAWNSHLMVMGIVCFVLLDVLLLVVYKDEIAGWFHHDLLGEALECRQEEGSGKQRRS